MEVAIQKSFWRLAYPDAKEEQLKAAREFIIGRDVFICLPTGSGKSMCCGCNWTDSVPIHCSGRKPILKIFMDVGLKAVFVGEVQDDHSIKQGVMNKEYSLMYMSPESMMTVLQWREVFRPHLYQQRLKSIVINDTYCVEK